MHTQLQALLGLLDLESAGENSFRGFSPADRVTRVFGGQVLAQALVAAARTVDSSRLCHSLHAYFLRPGDPREPILYEVDRSRDGLSFSVRRVAALQDGKQIFVLAASFQRQEAGFDHQSAMPDVPPPEALEGAAPGDLDPALAAFLARPQAFEMRPVLPGDPQKGAHLWLRARGEVGDSPALNRALLAYASDLSLLNTTLLPHGETIFSNIVVASLDHAMWFHRPFRVDRWLLYAQESPNASGARGLGMGAIYTREGALVASVAQEGLIRPRRG